MYDFSFRYNKWVFFQNADDQGEFLKFIKLDSHKTSLLPGSGIDITSFVPIEANNLNGTVFIMISRLIIEKGVRDYLKFIRIIIALHLEFYLVGELDKLASITSHQEELTQWVGQGIIKYVDHLADVRPLIAKAHVVVLPSYREGILRTLLEGGAMGKALLASDVPRMSRGCERRVQRISFQKTRPS